MHITRMIFLVSFLSVAVLTILSVDLAKADVIVERTDVILYSSNDVLMFQTQEVKERVKFTEDQGDTIYYRYDTTDFDPMKHDVYLEIFYTEEEWLAGPYPPLEQRRDFHSGESHAGDVKIENDEFGYYLFVWYNGGSERCTLEYVIGAKDSSSAKIPFPSLITIPAIIGTCILASFRSRKRTR